MASTTADANLRFEFEVVGKALNTIGIGLVSGAIAQLTCIFQTTAMSRTGVGLVVALAMMLAGELLTRRDKYSWWVGTSLMGWGYATAYFFVCAIDQVGWVSGYASPYPGWLLTMVLATMVTAQTSRNQILRWLGVPFALGITGRALMQALADTQVVSIAGYSIGVSAAASVVGMLWWLWLSVVYKKLELRYAQASPGDGAIASLYWSAHELCVLFAAVNALALPGYCSTMGQAPLWWSIEMPLMLAACWRSRNVLKHGFVMAVWLVAAGSLLSKQVDLDLVARMAVPASGLVMAMFYRFNRTNWTPGQMLTGYGVYLYGSVALALLIPVVHLGAHNMLHYWLVYTAVLGGLALLVRDRNLQWLTCLSAVGVGSIWAPQWQHWRAFEVIPVVVGCYGSSLLYAYIRKRGGWDSADFVPLSGPQMLTAKEAGRLETGAGMAGFAVLMTGSYVLFLNPTNTAVWGVTMFALTFYGLLIDNRWHRFSGLIAMGMASAKLTIFDLSGEVALIRILVSLAVVGFCCLFTSALYYWEVRRRNKQDQPPTTGNP